MPDRTHALVSPLANLQARKVASAVEALVAHAATDAAMAATLVARGVHPGTAHMVVEQWRALGLLVPADVYAPAHLLQAALLGTAVPAAQHIAATQPWLAQSIALAPGYERAMGAMPGLERAMAAPQPLRVSPWLAMMPAQALGMAHLGAHAGMSPLGMSPLGISPGLSPFAVSPGVSPLGMTALGPLAQPLGIDP